MAELALSGLSSAEPRLGQPWPPFHGADLYGFAQDQLAYLGEGAAALGDTRELALKPVKLRAPGPAECRGVVDTALPVPALQHQRALRHEQPDRELDRVDVAD